MLADPPRAAIPVPQIWSTISHRKSLTRSVSFVARRPPRKCPQRCNVDSCSDSLDAFLSLIVGGGTFRGPFPRTWLIPCIAMIRKRGGVHGRLGCWFVTLLTSRPLICPQKGTVLSPCNLTTAHLTACVLKLYLPWTSRPMKWRTLSQRPDRYCPVGWVGAPAWVWKLRMSDDREHKIDAAATRVPKHLWGNVD